MDTTASGATTGNGADDERDYEDLEVDDEAEFEAELALLNRSGILCYRHSPTTKLDHLLSRFNRE